MTDSINQAAARIASIRDQQRTMADCPFCKAKAEDFDIAVSYSTDLDGVVRNYMGECAQCAAMGPTASSPANAIKFWNASRGEVR